MALLIPEPAPVDKTKAGTLRISPCVLEAFLGLPAGQQIATATVDPLTGDIDLVVEGEGMPARPVDGESRRVELVCTRETRPGDVDGGGYQYRLTAAWTHSPEKSWVMRPWGAANATPQN